MAPRTLQQLQPPATAGTAPTDMGAPTGASASASGSAIFGAAPVATPVGRDWVDELFLAGDARATCLHLGRPITRGELRGEVVLAQRALASAGLAAGGAVALRLPPSLAFIVNLLAAWRIGAQVAVLDYRLTDHEVGRALSRIGSQFAVESRQHTVTGALRGYHDVTTVIRPLGGAPAATDHALIQLSSGSTGPSKIIGRTSPDVVAEIDRYLATREMPCASERIVLLASMVHVLGLVGGLLYGLHCDIPFTVPTRMTADGIHAAVAEAAEPTTLLAVPFHLQLLGSGARPPRLPQLAHIITGGELVRPGVSEQFTERYDAAHGHMYGMTEVGVIATDLLGRNRPGMLPVQGIRVRESGGELYVSRERSPYVGLVDPTRWADGWLRTKDAGSVDPATGLVTIHGRLDSQISLGGLKVDLTEVEQTIAELPRVREAVVVYDGAIQVFAAVDDPADASGLDGQLADRLAPYKRPRVWHLLDALPRTSSGKIVRDIGVLRSAAASAPAA